MIFNENTDLTLTRSFSTNRAFLDVDLFKSFLFFSSEKMKNLNFLEEENLFDFFNKEDRCFCCGQDVKKQEENLNFVLNNDLQEKIALIKSLHHYDDLLCHRCNIDLLENYLDENSKLQKELLKLNDNSLLINLTESNDIYFDKSEEKSLSSLF